mmetsp:Transcript_31757/g.64630  ORF Transcript_31757/g.64630 Transcript_31757/m.64630 type:complete len:122 (-) Transcript_31757:141-506(-)
MSSPSSSSGAAQNRTPAATYANIAPITSPPPIEKLQAFMAQKLELLTRNMHPAKAQPSREKNASARRTPLILRQPQQSAHQQNIMQQNVIKAAVPPVMRAEFILGSVQKGKLEENVVYSIR